MILIKRQEAFIKKYEDLAILHFDSHTNLKNPDSEGGYSALSSIRKITENKISKIISCGIRSMSKEDKEFIDQMKIFCKYMLSDLKIKPENFNDLSEGTLYSGILDKAKEEL